MPRKKKAAQPADSQESRTVTIYAEILQPTDSAVLIRCGESELWLPLSQIPDFNAERGDTNVEIAIPEWLAEEKGLSEGDGAPLESTPVRDCSSCGNLPLEWEAKMDKGKLTLLCPVCGERTPYGFDCALCATTLPATPAPCLECTRNPDLSEDLSIGLSDRWERRRRTFGDKVTWHREEHILIAQPLTEQEKIEYGQEMADALDQIEKYEAELDGQRKLYKRLIEQQEKIAKDAAKLYREGKEEREIFCDCLKDWNTFEMVWVEAEPPYAEVQRRPMTPEEKQPSLLDYDHKPESAEVAKAADAAKALEREPAECLEVQ